jgi:hypothetical protein
LAGQCRTGISNVILAKRKSDFEIARIMAQHIVRFLANQE